MFVVYGLPGSRSLAEMCAYWLCGAAGSLREESVRVLLLLRMLSPRVIGCSG